MWKITIRWALLNLKVCVFFFSLSKNLALGSIDHLNFFSCFICFCFHFLWTWYICFICRFILVLFSCPLLMECSLRFQREIAVHQFHILESILKEDSHICPKRKYKKFSLYAIVYNKKKEENLKLHQYEYNLLNYAIWKLWNSTQQIKRGEFCECCFIFFPLNTYPVVFKLLIE